MARREREEDTVRDTVDRFQQLLKVVESLIDSNNSDAVTKANAATKVATDAAAKLVKSAGDAKRRTKQERDDALREKARADKYRKGVEAFYKLAKERKQKAAAFDKANVEFAGSQKRTCKDAIATLQKMSYELRESADALAQMLEEHRGTMADALSDLKTAQKWCKLTDSELAVYDETLRVAIATQDKIDELHLVENLTQAMDHFDTSTAVGRYVKGEYEELEASEQKMAAEEEEEELDDVDEDDPIQQIREEATFPTFVAAELQMSETKFYDNYAPALQDCLAERIESEIGNLVEVTLMYYTGKRPSALLVTVALIDTMSTKWGILLNQLQEAMDEEDEDRMKSIEVKIGRMNNTFQEDMKKIDLYQALDDCRKYVFNDDDDGDGFRMQRPSKISVGRVQSDLLALYSWSFGHGVDWQRAVSDSNLGTFRSAVETQKATFERWMGDGDEAQMFLSFAVANLKELIEIGQLDRKKLDRYPKERNKDWIITNSKWYESEAGRNKDGSKLTYEDKWALMRLYIRDIIQSEAAKGGDKKK
jgi:hypothetical protein